MSDKDIRLISVPHSGPDWPVWPGYVAPYSYQEAMDKVRALITDKDISSAEVKDGLFSLMFDIFAVFDKALSKAQFEDWQREGMTRSPKGYGG